VVVALITLGVYARGDWKHTRLVQPGDDTAEQVTTEILASEGVR
jgi:hypothetical protein